ncbi:MAG: PhnD/SsuA/transferrin family substrate-binding protein [Desulfuromonadales bacterium]|nr:PhnD/SsuA/transferrin family substrate-binding protein [Desulfuromonadales bacterium]
MPCRPYKLLRRLMSCLILCALVFAATLVAADELSPPAIKIGILAKRGEERVRQRWVPTAEYLNSVIPEYRFEIVPLDFEEVRLATMSQSVDFLLINSGYFATLKADHGLHQIATLISLQNDIPQQFFGGVIFTRSTRHDIDQLRDLVGKSFWAVDQQSLGGWLAAWREFFDQGIHAERDFALLKYAGTHDAVVMAVLDGKADAGTVRTGTLEQMAAEGTISLDDFKILNRREPDGNFIFQLSTRLYPEWPFAALPHVPDSLVKKMTAALLAIPSNSAAARAAKITGWTKPLDDQAVQDLFRELHLCMYEKYISEITLKDFIRRYWMVGVFLSIFLTMVVLSAIYKDFLNKQLERRVAEKSDQLLQQVAERKVAEEKLQRAEKMEAIGLMASGVAHDLNNILSGVVSYPELLLMKLPEDSELRKPIQAIKDSGLRAADVVADLLTVARDAAKVRVQTNLNSLVLEYLQSPEAEKISSLYPQIEISTELAEGLPPICCSSTHVTKSIMNLMLNAAEAIETAGQISIQTALRQLSTPEAQALDVKPGKYVTLAIKDSGSGIDPADVRHIFEPFYTKKKMGRSGTGIGLSVVWNSMQDQEGTVAVESDQEQTTFTLFFPQSEDNCRPLVNKEVIEQDLSGHGERILIVDDEAGQREITQQILQEFGYHTTTAESGEAATALVKAEKFDLVLLDMVMGSGMDGLQTYKVLSELRTGQKALIISGFSESSKVKEALSLGVSGFLRKPYTMKQLVEGIKAALEN